MASCVLEEFDYQQGANLSFSLPDGTLILSSNGNDTHDRKDYKQNACFVKNLFQEASLSHITKTGRRFSPQNICSLCYKKSVWPQPIYPQQISTNYVIIYLYI